MNNNQANQSMFNDQNRLDDLLSQEKYLIGSYSTFIPEATCPQLRQVLTDNFNGCVQNQFTVFDQMTQMGWYQTKSAPVPEIQAARQKFSQLKQQLG